MERGPPRRRRRNGMACNCDCNYAKSLQGICKILQICIVGLAWILIAASPYYRPIFVIGGETWPFHVVLLISILVWFATIFLYGLFLSGYHLSVPNRNWPRFEVYTNVAMTIAILIAAILEAANVWRWDMSQGSVLTGGSAYSNYYQYGLRPGMTFTQTINLNSYCVTRPQECSSYFQLLAGNNTYYTNHLFAVVLLFFGLIVYLISTFFAIRTLRIFNRDMYLPGKKLKPTLWMKMQYRVENAAEKARNKMGKLVRRNGDDDEEDGGEVVVENKINEKIIEEDLEAGFNAPRSHNSHHHKSENGRSSRAYSHRHDEEEVKSSRSSSTDRKSRHSHHSSHHTHRSGRAGSERPRSRGGSERPSSHSGSKRHSPPEEKRGFDDKHVTSPPIQTVSALQSASKKSSKKNKKNQQDVEIDLAPVASVMI